MFLSSDTNLWLKCREVRCSTVKATTFLFIVISQQLGMSFLRQLNMERIVSSRLNPLKVWPGAYYSLCSRCMMLLVFLFYSCSFLLCSFLQICLPSVVDLFAQLTSRYELLFCYTLLEQNKRLVLSTGSSMGSGATVTAAQTANPLDCFFPFDPYTLKRYVLGREHSHATTMWILYLIT